jgi:hypothetical protein
VLAKVSPACIAILVIFHCYVSVVQMIFVAERHHWILTALLRGEIVLFDSFFSKLLPPTVEEQLLQLYSSWVKNNSLSVTILPMQQQRVGSVDCGVFTIAAAFHIAIGDDITTLTFDFMRMREHLLHCFEEQCVSPFPMKKKPVKRNHLTNIVIPAHCICRRPDSYNEMILCEECNRWYHFKCADVKAVPSGDWFCSDCCK